MVASATTIRRVHKQIELQQYKNSLINYSLYANSVGSWTGIKKHKIMSIDGSTFADRYAVCLQVSGKYPYIINYSRYKFGEELIAAYIMLSETLSVLQSNEIHVDLVCADGLYLNQNFLNLCIDNNISPFVKYTPDPSSKRRPIILDEADRIFASASLSKDIVYKEFEDNQRKEKVRMWYGKGFSMTGVKKQVNVIKVEETTFNYNKKQTTNTYYIVSTYDFIDKELEDKLSLEDARELAKGEGRWAIEIKGFRQLNQRFGSKTRFSENDSIFENILISTFLGYNLLSVYLFFMDRSSGIVEWRNAKKYITVIRIMRKLREELIILACMENISMLDSS